MCRWLECGIASLDYCSEASLCDCITVHRNTLYKGGLNIKIQFHQYRNSHEIDLLILAMWIPIPGKMALIMRRDPALLYWVVVWYKIILSIYFRTILLVPGSNPGWCQWRNHNTCSGLKSQLKRKCLFPLRKACVYLKPKFNLYGYKYSLEK